VNLLPRIAWRNIGRHRRRSAITATAMGFGAAVCIAMIAFADGWLGQIFDIVVGQQIGHVQIHDPDYPRQRPLHETIAEPEAVVATLDGLPESVAVSPRAHGFALLAVGDEAAGVQVTGIDPERERQVTALADHLVEGRYLDGASGQMLLGVGLAESLGAALGDEVVAVTQAADGSMGSALYSVTGIYRTGSARLDRGGAFVTLAEIQDLLVLGDGVHEIAFNASSREEIPALVAAAEAALEGRGLLVRTWSQIDPALGQMLELTDAMIWIILIFIFSVASLGILNTMLMSVFERIRELGVAQALGLRPLQVLRLVLWETLFLSLMAAAGGAALGVLGAWLLENRGLDLSGLMGEYGMAGVVFEPIVYGDLRFDRVVVVLIFMFVVAFLASIWPAIRAARLDPVAAMREG
jgi:putative ABC transport system permease protein